MLTCAIIHKVVTIHAPSNLWVSPAVVVRCSFLSLPRSTESVACDSDIFFVFWGIMWEMLIGNLKKIPGTSHLFISLPTFNVFCPDPHCVVLPSFTVSSFCALPLTNRKDRPNEKHKLLGRVKNTNLSTSYGMKRVIKIQAFKNHLSVLR